ncbi:hypothetical protein BRD17_05605 [Halobacteriales archaeon SW_7_68_16]|nr:MAG: hypothetical protein BRD17_05605 [Halobacteriales archaeon SW_7_68_16]
MSDRTPAPTLPVVGALASLVAVLVVLAPFVLLRGAESAGLGTYYEFGLVGPEIVALLAAVATVAFEGARRGQTPPETVAGATIVLGGVATLVALQWAIAVDGAVVGSITTADWLDIHRWLVVGAAAVVDGVAVAYARRLGLV